MKNLIPILFFFLPLTQVFYAQMPLSSMMQFPVQVTYETGGVSDFVWSPDGSQFAYIALYNDTTRLYRVDMNGSNKTELYCNAYGQIDWKDTVIVFMSYDPSIPSYNNLIKKINPDGTGASTIIGPDWYTGVYLRADANWILYRQAPNGWWKAMRCDLNGGNQLALSHNPGSTNSLVQQVSWLGENQVIYSHGTNYYTTCSIWRVNFDGSNRITLNAGNLPNNTTFIASPDTNKILFCDGTGNNWDIYIMNIDGSNPTQLTLDPARDYLSNTRDNIWSEDCQSFYFVSDRSGNGDIYRINIDGSNLTQITFSDSLDYNPIMSPDGTKLAFISKRDGANNIWVIDLFPVGWFQQSNGTTENIWDVYFVNDYVGWIVDHQGSIYKTTNGGTTWEQQLGGPYLWRLDCIKFTDINTGTAVGANGTIMRTSNGGYTWEQQSSGTTEWLVGVDFTDANHGFAVGSNGVILRTTNGGTSWLGQISGTTELLMSVSFANADNGIVVGFNGIILRTTNGGATWLQQSSGTNYSLWDVNFIDANIATIVGSNGIILRTTNGGTNWAVQNSATTNPLFSVSFISADIGTAVGGGGKIIRTTDGGISWIAQISGTAQDLNCVYFMDENNGCAVGWNGTILRTWNGGLPVELTSFTASVDKNIVTLNWNTATELNNQGFEVERSQKSEIKSQYEWEKIGYVPGFGTTGESRSYSFVDRDLEPGKYSYRLKQIDYDGTFEYSQKVRVEIASLTPTEFSLEQNYPNPFNPVTTIKYNLPVKNLVTLKIFNILGEEIKTLVNEIKEAGSHQVEFSANNLPSGIYFYRIKAGEFVSIKKMVLLK